MITTESRPRLAPKVRLRYDHRGERWMLLYPEKGLVLNGTAAAVVQLCTGQNSVTEIVDSLARTYTAQSREALERQVTDFLRAMADRGLMQGVV